MAQSVTGKGLGSSGKLTEKELAILANSMNIILAGRVDLEEDLLVNPPSPTARVTFNEALPGSKTNYVVLVTGLNTGLIYLLNMSDVDGNFASFRVLGEEEGTCMYVVAKVGLKPQV